MDNIKIRRLVWVGHIIRMEYKRIPKKKFLMGNYTNKNSGKTKNKTGGRCPEGHITNPRNMMEMSTEQEWRHLLWEAGAQKGL